MAEKWVPYRRWVKCWKCFGSGTGRAKHASCLIGGGCSCSPKCDKCGGQGGRWKVG